MIWFLNSIYQVLAIRSLVWSKISYCAQIIPFDKKFIDKITSITKQCLGSDKYFYKILFKKIENGGYNLFSLYNQCLSLFSKNIIHLCKSEDISVRIMRETIILFLGINRKESQPWLHILLKKGLVRNRR